MSEFARQGVGPATDADLPGVAFSLTPPQPREGGMPIPQARAYATHYRVYQLRNNRLNPMPSAHDTMNQARARAAELSAHFGLPARFLDWTQDPKATRGDDCVLVCETKICMNDGQVVHKEIM